ncbi:hypothetical protein JYK14_16470 [Siccirubricoccus sp. KC 17139]|uniref:Uncharacterized protein n=1 Tax=Siccirubricoccus soli TaxID=2899147 RepID=A0ABT1D737_9PROT|nr:hypothetical protein [Siccirubricoccus soli]MCO6417743.1 hypothetical protein [Siccirubricoccus soli]MCP2683878.1 hypothetical protein [Siccirubricoccus soli]
MIDNFGILVTCLACLYVAFRAVQLDAMLPWFQPPQRPLAEAEEVEATPPPAAPRRAARTAAPRPAGAEARRAPEPPTPPRTPGGGGWRARARPPEGL